MYEILGLPKDADLMLIKSVYKSLGHIYHPDKYQGDSKYAEEKMKDINLAYSVLSNDVKRREYDNNHKIKSEPFVNNRENQTFKKKYKHNFDKKKFKETLSRWRQTDEFKEAKKGEKRESQQTLKCDRQTYDLTSKEVYNYFEDFEKFFKRYGFDIPKMFQK